MADKAKLKNGMELPSKRPKLEQNSKVPDSSRSEMDDEPEKRHVNTKRDAAHQDWNETDVELASMTSRSSFPDTLTLRDVNGACVRGDVQCPNGETCIKDPQYRDRFTPLSLQKPMYLFRDVKLSLGMGAPGNCLVMDESDFHLVKKTIHTGAFGQGYDDIIFLRAGDGDNYDIFAGRWAVIWKFPADLNFIEGYRVLATSNMVGCYPMTDDRWTTAPNDMNGLKDQVFTKIRMDIPSDDGSLGSSVHHLQHAGRPAVRVAAFSTGNVFEDFNFKITPQSPHFSREPTEKERGRITTLFYGLAGAGVTAFLCNEKHHLIVIYEDSWSDSALMTPERFAKLLEDPERGQSLINVLKVAIYDNRINVDEWRKNYIIVYGTPSRIQEGSAGVL